MTDPAMPTGRHALLAALTGIGIALVVLFDVLPIGVIARRLGVSQSTIRTHIRHIQDKFGTFAMAEITRVAVLHELEGCCAGERAHH